MLRFALPVGLALVLPSCGGSDVSCSYEVSGLVAGCADYMFSGDSQGQDVTSLEQTACTSGGGTVVGSCSTANTLGACTVSLRPSPPSSRCTPWAARPRRRPRWSARP